MKLLYAVVAEIILRDFQSNSFSAINIIEGVKAEGTPALFPQVNFLTVWEKQEGDKEVEEFQFVVKLNENILFQQAATMGFEGRRRGRLNVSLRGLALPGGGELEFSVTSKAGLKASSTIEVEIPTPKPERV